MSPPSLASLVTDANRAARREAALDAKRAGLGRRGRRPGPSPRSRILQFLADGRAHRFAEILAATGCPHSSAAWGLAVLIKSGRVERIGERRPCHYRIA